jgi:hypothetical protein
MNGLVDWQSTQKNPLIDYSIVYTDTMYHSVFFRGSQAMIKKCICVHRHGGCIIKQMNIIGSHIE